MISLAKSLKEGVLRWSFDAHRTLAQGPLACQSTGVAVATKEKVPQATAQETLRASAGRG